MSPLQVIGKLVVLTGWVFWCYPSCHQLAEQSVSDKMASTTAWNKIHGRQNYHSRLPVSLNNNLNVSVKELQSSQIWSSFRRWSGMVLEELSKLFHYKNTTWMITWSENYMAVSFSLSSDTASSWKPVSLTLSFDFPSSKIDCMASRQSANS